MGKRKVPPSEEDDDEEFDGFAYKVARLNGSVGSGAKRKFIVQWQGSNFRGDTVEPEANVWPLSHISRLDAHLVTFSVTQQPLLDLRTAVHRRVCSRKIGERDPVWEFPLKIPFIHDEAVARGLLAFLRQRRGGGLHPLAGELDLSLEQPLDVADAIAFHHVDSSKSVGNVRLKCGGASYEDMALLSRLRLTFSGRTLTAYLTLVIFNGKTGMPKFPKAGKQVKYSLGERNILVKHTKRALLQEWAPEPIPTFLRKVGWHALPDGVAGWRVPDAVATGRARLELPARLWPKTAADIGRQWPAEYSPAGSVPLSA